eukprot:CAMPEP_0115509830 /NCGR_PEP_ID=MMETSP0271-20121206/73066_1 /TAXON_ID=71861 /ORGANISM="Scrippsiella trochoidea, Strain CCMP3099" /LENGTH=190 /DNA_ID=CAMNT_0002939709 /DNA_START=278 /DNA_END=850 /DNA_ORIENTATION=-
MGSASNCSARVTATSKRSPKPSSSQFSRIARAQVEEKSQNVTCPMPRDRASKPTTPEPEKMSSMDMFSSRSQADNIIEYKDSLTMPIIGRAWTFGMFTYLPLHSPPVRRSVVGTRRARNATAVLPPEVRRRTPGSKQKVQGEGEWLREACSGDKKSSRSGHRPDTESRHDNIATARAERTMVGTDAIIPL